MKLIAFDFDDTLFYTPDSKNGQVQYKQMTGEDWPHRGWWGRPESLNMNIFNIQINKGVYQKYLDYKSDDDNYIFLATGRLEKLEQEVKNIINHYNLEFDQIFLNPGMDTLKFKLNLFSKLIRQISPSEFILFDDRDPHLDQFRIWGKTQIIPVTVIDAKKL